MLTEFFNLKFLYKKSIILLIFITMFFMACQVPSDGSGGGGGDGSTAPVYTVTYNGNGNTSGNIPTDGKSYSSGATVTVLGNTGSLVKAGYAFTGWNTASDGNGTAYSAGASFSMGNDNVTLYAQWVVGVYTVTYNGNGSTSGNAPTDGNSYPAGAIVTVRNNTGSLVKAGYAFTGWNTASDGNGTAYSAGATFSMGSDNVTLYAQWVVAYTVTYNGNGNTSGSVPTDGNSYASGDTVTVRNNTGSLVKAGYAFTGWNTAFNGSGTAYSAGATFSMESDNVTLYAQWVVAYRVSYLQNTNSSYTFGSTPSDSNSYLSGETATVLGNTNTLCRYGYRFTGWNTNSSGTGTNYSAGDTIAMTSNVTLYARWTSCSYSLGSTGPAGGIIVFINTTSDYGWKYLEAAPVSLEKTDRTWGLYNVANVNYSSGTLRSGGVENTKTAYAKMQSLGDLENPSSSTKNYTSAVKYCVELSHNGYNDWYLPNVTEIANIEGACYSGSIGSFSNVWYWTSTPYYDGSIYSWFYQWSAGGSNCDKRNTEHYCRPIRRF